MPDRSRNRSVPARKPSRLVAARTPDRTPALLPGGVVAPPPAPTPPAPLPTPESPVPPVPPPPVPTPVPPAVPPAPGSFAVTGHVPNITSDVVSFSAVPGAVDYRVYNPAHLHGTSHMYKYSGGGLRIEINDLNPEAALHPDYVVEAVDALGPFQRIDGDTPHSAMRHINGQGPSTNAPVVIAASAPFKPQTTTKPWPTQAGGVSLFRDTFEDTTPGTTTFSLAATPTKTPTQAAMSVEFYATWHTRYQSRNWLVDFLGHERGQESIFIHHRHLMDIILDGEQRNNNASSVLQPLVNSAPVTFDLAGGAIVHLTYEVDAHYQSRRWCELQLIPADETFLNPGKFEITGGNRSPTESGRLIRWQVLAEFHSLDVFGPWSGTTPGTTTPQINSGHGAGTERWDTTLNITRIRFDGLPLFNGTMKDLDLRHKFDMYLSQSEYALYEDGVRVKRAAWNTPLPFTSMKSAFVHQIYHTENEAPDREGGQPYYQYINQSDERHWAGFGIEYVPSFPV